MIDVTPTVNDLLIQMERDTKLLEDWARDQIQLAFRQYETGTEEGDRRGDQLSEIFHNLCHQADKIWDSNAHPVLGRRSPLASRIYKEEWNRRYA